MNTILIIEDDRHLLRLYASVLKKAHFKTVEALNGAEALDILDKQYVDLIITDVMMPEMDGFEFSELLREAGDKTPILMITAKDTFEDKQRGFKLGIDDYMVKPIDVKEMVLRVEALLRRAKVFYSQELVVGKTSLNQDELTVTVKGETSLLPQKEFQLLHKLLSYPGKIFTRQQLMDRIWGLETDTEERTIDVHIKRLRTRFEENTDFQIVTVRGLGYKAVVTHEK
ncbi:DNA-binding response regulator [Enterococcus sp. JM4C]|uniref:response regulator transcription factor n=1 Tax=Candidatus Enterococcus huntleyi TaxID=1857217 RepID=UPI00137B3882|nr:response regulator transcription factor [Enterococcus sp. JM4C]KAF1297383.1 DNA-binding response regulator [Enterococcus sp. JM4C]